MKALIFIINISIASIPFKYMLHSSSSTSNDFLPSNQILDIEVLNSDIYLSTGKGLGRSSVSQNSYVFDRILSDQMVQGGNPALAISGNVIAVSGSIAVLRCWFGLLRFGVLVFVFCSVVVGRR